jgi:hypothetical protein
MEQIHVSEALVNRIRQIHEERMLFGCSAVMGEYWLEVNP